MLVLFGVIPILLMLCSLKIFWKLLVIVVDMVMCLMVDEGENLGSFFI